MCGRLLTRRGHEVIHEELGKVEWLLTEAPRWDVTLVGTADVRRLTRFYGQQAEWLKSELGGVELTREEAPTSSESAVEVAPTEARVMAVEAEAVVSPPAVFEEQPAEEPAPATVSEAPAHPLEATAAPAVEARVVEAASAWSRLWKPFLTDSVGWFVGGFLILAGVYFLVVDAWDGMTSLSRALTVFGLASGWTLAFFAWAKFLLRREVTAPAARMLERLAAAMAPIATVAVGPIHDAPLLFWPLTLGWSLVTGWLAARATKRLDEGSGLPVGVGFGLASAMMGLAPVLMPLGVQATWLVALPVGVAAWTFSRGPRSTDAANRFLVVAFSWAIVLFAARLQVALVMTHQPLALTLLAPMLALFVASVRWLAKPPTTAADALSVMVVVAQVGLLIASFDLFTPKPAFVVTALVGAWTAWSLAKERVNSNSARWLPVAYTFAYLAYQRIDQLVPEVVRALYQQLKVNLGYSVAPLPASYGSVYSALFIVVVGALSLRWARSAVEHTRREGLVLLDTTAVATALSSLLALVSVQADARPAVIATPILALSTGLFAWRSRRLHLTIAGVVAALAMGTAFAIGPKWTWVFGAVGVLLAALAVKTQKAHRLTLSIGAGAASVSALALGLLATPGFGATLTLALAAVAMLLVAATTEKDELLELAWAGPVLTIVGAARWLAPGLEPVVLGLTSVLLGVVQVRGEGGWQARLSTAKTATLLSAVGAVAWQFLVPAPIVAPGVTLLLSALALFLLSRVGAGALSVVLETVAAALALSTLVPSASLFPWPSPLVPELLAGVVVAGSSVMTVLRGRQWRWGWLAALGALVALSCCVGLSAGSLWLAASIVVLATPALAPEVTLPVAAIVTGLSLALHLPEEQLGLAFTIQAVVLGALGLLDRLTQVRKVVGRDLGWPAAVMSALSLVPALVARPMVSWLPVVASVIVPVLWSVSLRRRGARLFAPALVAATAFWLGPEASFLAPVVALAVAFSIRSTGKERDLILDRLTVWVVASVALASSLAGVAEFHQPFLPLAWAVVLAVLPAGALAARLLVVAVLLVLSPSATVGLGAVAALFGIAFALRHLPELTGKLLGARSIEFAPSFSAFSALGVAIVVFARFPSALTFWCAIAALVLTALLSGFAALVSVAVVAASVDGVRVVHSGHVALEPWAMWLALVVGALTVVLRRGFALEAVEETWERLGQSGRGLDRASWCGAALVVGLALFDPSLWWLAPAAVLLFTRSRVESVVGTALVGAMVLASLPLATAGVLLAALGATLAWIGATRESEAASVRLHLGWVLALSSLGLTAELHAWQMPLAWVLAAVTSWALVKRYPAARWIGWGATWAASHAVLAWAGITLSTGAPKELIFPWFALASALVAIIPTLRPSVSQHGGISVVLRAIAVLELAAGMVLCDGLHERDAIGALVAIGVSGWLAWHEAKDDEPAGLWLGALALSFGGGLVHVLFGGALGSGEAIGLVVIAVLSSALAAKLSDGFPVVSRSLGQIALLWPVAALIAVPWGSPMVAASFLVAMAVHYALLAQGEGRRALASIFSAVAFNAAVLCFWFGAGFGDVQYVLVPMGLSGLVLVHVFARDLGDVWAARLRGVAVALIYGAAAFRPLAFDSTWAFLLCVTLCVAGVAAGIALRVRSFVTLGTGFLVTTVLATLVRWGVREPRLGALFLSGLGLAVVAFMVLVTTKRHELLDRYKRVRGALERWDA